MKTQNSQRFYINTIELNPSHKYSNSNKNFLNIVLRTDLEQMNCSPGIIILKSFNYRQYKQKFAQIHYLFLFAVLSVFSKIEPAAFSQVKSMILKNLTQSLMQ